MRAFAGAVSGLGPNRIGLKQGTAHIRRPDHNAPGGASDIALESPCHPQLAPRGS